MGGGFLSRLIVVSNRVAPVDEGQTAAGGLAVAVLAALKESGGIWFGWNGETAQTPPAKPDTQKIGSLTYATMPMTRRDYTEYYTGFANSTLWPLFHYRLDLMRYDRRDFTGLYAGQWPVRPDAEPDAAEKRSGVGS